MHETNARRPAETAAERYVLLQAFCKQLSETLSRSLVFFYTCIHYFANRIATTEPFGKNEI
jgi:hypothetical protein